MFTLDDIRPGDAIVFQDPIEGITLTSGTAPVLAVVLREVTQAEVAALSGTYGVLARGGVVAVWATLAGSDNPVPVDVATVISVLPARKASDLTAALLPLQA